MPQMVIESKMIQLRSKLGGPSDDWAGAVKRIAERLQGHHKNGNSTKLRKA